MVPRSQVWVMKRMLRPLRKGKSSRCERKRFSREHEKLVIRQEAS